MARFGFAGDGDGRTEGSTARAASSSCSQRLPRPVLRGAEGGGSSAVPRSLRAGGRYASGRELNTIAVLSRSMDRISKLAGTTMDVAGTLTEKTKALSQEAVERTGTIVEKTGGAFADAKDAVQRVEARADEAILSSMDRIRTASRPRSDSPGSGGESNDITEQSEYSPPLIVEAERGRIGGGLARFTGEALGAATSVGRSSMSMLRHEPPADPEPDIAASGGYSTRSWTSRAADANTPLDRGQGRTDPDIEPTHSPPGAAANKRKGVWWKGPRRDGDSESSVRRQPLDDDEEEFGERKGLLSGVGDVSGRVASATAQKARAAGQKVGLVDKPPETLIEQVQSELPSLKKKTRVKSFAVCFTLGCCLMMLSTVFIPTIALAPCVALLTQPDTHTGKSGQCVLCSVGSNGT